MNCMVCGNSGAVNVAGMCEDCTAAFWRKCREADKLVELGHSRHCAMRIVFGKEECSCKGEESET